MTLQRFRHVPNEIVAVQYTGKNAGEIIDIFGLGKISETVSAVDDENVLEFVTAHGDVAYARSGDWVVPDSKPDTFYPILGEVFEDTYLEVGEDAPKETLSMPWPRIVTGQPVTAAMLKEAWTEFMTPLQEAGRGSEPNVQVMLAVLRHVYGGMQG